MKSLITLVSLLLFINTGSGSEFIENENIAAIGKQNLTSLSVPMQDESKVNMAELKKVEQIAKVDSAKSDYFYITSSNQKPKMKESIN